MEKKNKKKTVKQTKVQKDTKKIYSNKFKFWIVTIIIIVLLSSLYIYGHIKTHQKKEETKNEEVVEMDLNSLVPYIESDDNYLLIANYYQLNTSVEDNKIIIDFSNEEHQGKLKGKLKNQLLSFKINNDDENALLKAMLIYSIVDGLGQINGNDKGYVSAMIGDYNLESATLEKDGIELVSEENSNIYRFKVDKKFNLGDILENYFKVSDLEQYKEAFNRDQYVETKQGNLILYKDTDFYKKNIIYICEPSNLTTRTYNSLLSVIELLYGLEYKEKFASAYPELKKEKVLDKFDIEVDYQPTDTDVIKKIVTKNYKMIKVTYKK